MASVPIECVTLQTELDGLNRQQLALEQRLQHAAPQDKPSLIKQIGMVESKISQAQDALSACITAYPEPPDAPQATAPIIQIDCSSYQFRLTDFNNRLALLQQRLQNAAPTQKPEIIRQIGPMEINAEKAEAALAKCQEEQRAQNAPSPLTKVVPLALLRRKFDTFINKRDPAHPLFKITASTFDKKTSYIDVSFISDIGYNSFAHLDLPPFTVAGVDTGFYFNDMNSNNFCVTFDSTDPVLLTFKVVFETGGPVELPNSNPEINDVDLIEFSIAITFTLYDAAKSRIDLLNWLDMIEATSDDDIQDSLKEKFIKVVLVSTRKGDFGGTIRQTIRDRIYTMLTTKDATGISPRMLINSYASKWLLGGSGDYTINNVKNDGSSLTITYSVPAIQLTPFSEKWPTQPQFVQGRLRQHRSHRGADDGEPVF